MRSAFIAEHLRLPAVIPWADPSSGCQGNASVKCRGALVGGHRVTRVSRHAVI